MDTKELIERINDKLTLIYKNLNLDKKDITFDIITEYNIEGNTETIPAIGYVNNTLCAEINESGTRIYLETDNVIHINETAISVSARDLLKACDSNNEELYELVRIIEVENTIVHELLHIYQNKYFRLDSSDVIFSKVNDIWTVNITDTTKETLEFMAIGFTRSMGFMTIIKDYPLKDLVTTTRYYSALSMLSKRIVDSLNIPLLPSIDKLSEYIHKYYENKEEE